MVSSPEAIRCDACGKRYAYKPEHAGRRLKCKCGAVIEVPAVESEPAAFDPADLEAAAQQEATSQPTAAPAAAAATGVPTKKEDGWKWWYYVAGGVGTILFGLYEFARLGDLEDGTAASISVTKWEAALYNLLGRGGVLGAFVLLAALMLAAGTVVFLEEQKKKRAGA